MPESVRRLRTNKLKTDREARTAALFAHGMASVVGAKVLLAPGEIEDCDFITCFTTGGTNNFSCVQLKELAPADLAPAHTIESLISGLYGLPRSDAVLAIHLNRRDHITFDRLRVTDVPFAEVWYLWASTPDSATWYLYGDALKSPTPYEFAYPHD